MGEVRTDTPQHCRMIRRFLACVLVSPLQIGNILKVDSEVEISKQSIFFQGDGELLRSMTMEGKREGQADGEGEIECGGLSRLYRALGFKDSPSEVSPVGVRSLMIWSFNAVSHHGLHREEMRATVSAEAPTGWGEGGCASLWQRGTRESSISFSHTRKLTHIPRLTDIHVTDDRQTDRQAHGLLPDSFQGSTLPQPECQRGDTRLRISQNSLPNYL